MLVFNHAFSTLTVCLSHCSTIRWAIQVRAMHLSKEYIFSTSSVIHLSSLLVFSTSHPLINHSYIIYLTPASITCIYYPASFSSLPDFCHAIPTHSTLTSVFTHIYIFFYHVEVMIFHLKALLLLTQTLWRWVIHWLSGILLLHPLRLVFNGLYFSPGLQIEPMCCVHQYELCTVSN